MRPVTFAGAVTTALSASVTTTGIVIVLALIAFLSSAAAVTVMFVCPFLTPVTTIEPADATVAIDSSSDLNEIAVLAEALISAFSPTFTMTEVLSTVRVFSRGFTMSEAPY